MSIVWKTVYGLDHLLVSTDGQVKSKARLCYRKDGGKGETQWRTERMLLPAEKSGYLWINSSFQGKRKFVSVHRLVVESFMRPLEPGEEINHINGQRQDNRLDNLEIMTNKLEHAKKTKERIEKRIYDRGYNDGLRDGIQIGREEGLAIAVAKTVK